MDYSNVFPESEKPSEGIDAFGTVPNAPEFVPIPPGVYAARVLRGEFCTTKANAGAYRLRFEVTEGPHVGRTLIRQFSFSAKALPFTQRELAAFGLTTKVQLLSLFPEPGCDYLVRLVVALQRGDDGIERNDIKKIDVVRVVESPAIAFMLPTPKDLSEAEKPSAKGNASLSLFGSDDDPLGGLR